MRTKLTLAGALALAALTGCGSSEPPQTPVACLAPASAYVRALAAAPGDVRLEGGTAISSCPTEQQPAGDLQTFGKSVVGAATRLNAEALRRSNPAAALELGYLVAAVQKGAEKTGGIHRDLVLRLESAARFSGPGGGSLPPGFEPAYARGRAAGQASG